MAEIAVEATEVPAQLPQVRVAVLGAGKMGGILLQAFLKENLFAPEQIHATVGHAERALALSTQWGVDVSTDNLEAARQSDLILIGVKPFQVPDLIAEIKPALTQAKTTGLVCGLGEDARDRGGGGHGDRRDSRHAQHAFGAGRGRGGAVPRALRLRRADGAGAAHL